MQIQEVITNSLRKSKWMTIEMYNEHMGTHARKLNGGCCPKNDYMHKSGIKNYNCSAQHNITCTACVCTDSSDWRLL